MKRLYSLPLNKTEAELLQLTLDRAIGHWHTSKRDGKALEKIWARIEAMLGRESFNVRTRG